MFRILYLIIILFMCVVLPLNFLLAPIVGEINTGGSPLYIIIMIVFLAVCITFAVLFYKRLSNSKEEEEPVSKELQEGFRRLDELKKMQLEQSMGGEGAKATVEVTEEIVTNKTELTDFEKSAIENAKNLGESGDIDWTISTVETNGERNVEYNASISGKDKAIVGAKKANKVTQTIFKVLGLVVLLAIEALLLVGAVSKVTVFGSVSIKDASFKSISNVAGYYINCESKSYQKNDYGDSLYISYTYTYSTNKKTDEVAQKYLEYIKEACNNHYYDGSYYVTDPNNSEFVYMVTIYNSHEDSVTITYEYQEKSPYMY